MDTETRQDFTMTLPDGRRLGLAEVGDPAGVPVVYCHGFPASRLESRLIADAASKLGVRIVAPDRPGYGLSDWQSGRCIPDWADDVAALADHLGLEKFSVLGVSGGGPYGLALACCLPDRVNAAAIVCGLGPVWRAEALHSMHWPARFGFDGARRAPWLVGLVYGGFLGQMMRHQPEVALAMLTVGSPGADRRVLSRPDIHAVICASVREALRQGTRGALLDMALYAHDWGFAPAEVAVPVTFWHGEADATVPVLHTRLLAESMPQAVVRRLPDEGHFSLPIERAGEILESLLRDERTY